MATSVRSRLELLESTLRAKSLYNSIEWQRRRRRLLRAMSESVGGNPLFQPTPRWTTLRPHEKQRQLWYDNIRIRFVPAGRRSGKTELAKRFGVLDACSYGLGTAGWIHFVAPVRKQAKDIYWEDIKALVPKEFRVGDPMESDLTIRLFNGVRLNVAGMDEPARIEGHPILGIVLDEFGNMKPKAWTHHVRPALADTGGWAWLIGVPEGRNHYYEEVENAYHDESGQKRVYSWSSRTVLPEEEIRAMEESMDEVTLAQEVDASFVNFVGRVYYSFNRDENVVAEVPYDPKADLFFCFDFNVNPGTASVAQDCDGKTFVLDEVYIPNDSNTPLVCKQLRTRWGSHEGRVLLYGDATGGARGTAKIHGTDWDLIRQELGPIFGQRLRDYVPRSNPEERVRINSVNSRIKTASGERRLFVAKKCRYMIRDLEGVRYKEGTGDIDKDNDRNLTHLSDGLGYMVHARHPMSSQRAKVVAGPI